MTWGTGAWGELPWASEPEAAAGGAYTLTCDAGAYVLAGQDAALKRGRVVSADAGAYALAGQDATLTYALANAYTLTCEAGAYAIGGQDAAFFYSGEEVATPRRHAGGYRQRKGYIIKGQRYWLDEVELAVKVAELITDISRGDVKEVTAGKPKTISKRTWDAIKPLERIEAMADMLKPHDDEEEALLMLM